MSLFSALPSEIQRLESYIAGIKDAFAGKSATDEKITQLEAELASTKAELSLAQASLSTAEATEADLTARLKTANDALAQTIHADASPPTEAPPAPAAA